MNNMTDEERKMYFDILAENLYSKLKMVSEGTVPNKKEMMEVLIQNFYEKFKEDYNIKNTGEVKEKLCEIGKKIEELHKPKEPDER